MGHSLDSDPDGGVHCDGKVPGSLWWGEALLYVALQNETANAESLVTKTAEGAGWWNSVCAEGHGIGDHSDCFKYDD